MGCREVSLHTGEGLSKGCILREKLKVFVKITRFEACLHAD